VTRPYSRCVGIALVLFGLFGLAWSTLQDEEPLFGLLNIGPLESSFHLVTGALLLYVGFRVASLGLARAVVGVIGVVYLLVAALFFVSSDLFDTLPSDFTDADNLLHLVVGLLGVAAALPIGRRAVPAT
jgi:hypothetical protein